VITQKTLAIDSNAQDWIPYVVVDSDSRCGVYFGGSGATVEIAMAADKTPTGIL